MSLSDRLGVLGAAGIVLVLAVTAARGASYEDLAAKAKASREAADKAGAKLSQPPKDPDEFLFAYGYPDAGAVLFWPDVAEPLVDRPPTSADVLRRPWVLLARDETAGLILAAYTVRAAQDVRLRVRVVDGRGDKVAGLSAAAHPIVFAPVAERNRGTYRLQALWLADPGPIPAQEGHLAAWFIRMQAAADAAPGGYRLHVEAAWANQDPATAPTDSLRVTVLPVRLANPAKHHYTFGAFCAGADFSEAQFRQMERHGLDAFLFFWGHFGIDLRNEDGRLVMDFTRLDAMVERFRKSGMYGPIVMALGNDSSGHFERKIAETFNLPMQPRVPREGKVVRLATLDDPRIEQRMVEALEQLFAHAKQKNWPEVVIMPYDEPTERLMDEHRRMVRLFREHFPHVRLYGVTMNRLAWAEMLLDTDILVANGDWARIRDLARRNDRNVWFYGGVTAAQGFGACRERFGLRPYVHHPDGMWFWSYNFHVDDPWNDFDGPTPDSAWVICWPPLKAGDESVSTPGYEGLCAAVNDVRYALTLEAILKDAKSPAAAHVGRQYESWRQQAQQAPPSAAELPRVRAQLVRWILDAQGQPPPKGFDRLAPASTRPTATLPAATQPATHPDRFAPVENEQD